MAPNLVTVAQNMDGSPEVASWDVDIAGNITLNDGIGIDRDTGSASMISLAAHPDAHRLVTAVRDGRGKLKVIVWGVDGTGRVTRLGEDGAGSIDLVSVINVESDRFAAAVQDSAGNLKIIVWEVDGAGRVTRLGDERAGSVGLVSITSLGIGRIVTAVQDGGGRLKVIVWDVDGAGNVIRRGDGRAGSIGLISTVTVDTRRSLGGDSRFATAVQDGEGNLNVVVWGVDRAGTVTQLGDNRAGSVGLVSAAHLGVRPINRIATAVQDSSDKLKIIVWDVDGAGNVVRLDDNRAGSADLVSAASLHFWHSDADCDMRLVTAVQDSRGRLKIIVWGVDRAGTLNRLGDFGGGAVDLLLAAAL